MAASQRLTDEGQELAEREQSNAFVAWQQAKKEMEAELRARLAAAPRCERVGLQWGELSLEWKAWMDANPKPPEPPRRYSAKPARLVLVGRDAHRSGPMTDG